MAIEEFVTRCCECKKIRILDEQDFWIKEEDNPQLYEKIISQSKISDGYCKECASKIAEKYNLK